jgi:hypothetical protein
MFTQENNVKARGKKGGFIIGLFFDPKDRGNMFLRNVG